MTLELYLRFQDKPEQLRRANPSLFNEFLEEMYTIARTREVGFTEHEYVSRYNSWLRDFCNMEETEL